MNYFSKSNLPLPYPASHAGVRRCLSETQEHVLLEDLEHLNIYR